MKLRAPVKLALAFAAICGVGFGGYYGFTTAYLSRVQLPALKPGTVNLVFIDPDTGYRLVVANRMARLVSGGTENFEAPEAEKADEGDSNVVRIPVKEMLDSLNGDTASLSVLVSMMNKLKDEDLPTTRRVWKAEDIRKVLDGDESLRHKLEADLNMTLDGKPLPTLDLVAMDNGIVVDIPVQVKMVVAGKEQIQVARILLPYLPSFMKSVSDSFVETGKAEGNEEVAFKIYQDMSARLKETESIRGKLEALIAPGRAKSLATAPEALLSGVRIVANNAQMVGASYTKEVVRGKEQFNLHINVTGEGRDRLWKLSRDHQHFQLLFTVDGIAVAAPRVAHEMFQTDVMISQLPDEELVKQAVDRINELKK
ncbi:MAG: hypothetical protein JST40_05100 [Armatimonadetes bacterium]|nr:hypothetical protein [Armatimonadota bacterium]